MNSPALDPPAAACPLCNGPVQPWADKSRGGVTYRYDRCRACGFALVNPRPTRAWLDDHYRRGDPRPITTAAPFATPADVPDPGPWPNRVTAATLALGRPGGRWLDVGAGSGWFAAAAVRAGLSVTALELDPADLAELRRLPNLTAVAAGLEAFDAPAGSFDYVFLSHVLEHAHDPRAWVQRSAELLADGGVISIHLPHFNSLYRLLGGTRDPYFFPPEHLNHFDRRSLGHLLRSCGLTPARSWTHGGLPADAVTKRLSLPAAVAAAVRAATACVGFAVDSTTRLTGTGPVLSMLAVKR